MDKSSQRGKGRVRKRYRETLAKKIASRLKRFFLDGLWSEEESLIIKNQPAVVKNKGRAQAICDTRLKRTYGRRYPKVAQFSLILNVDPQTTRREQVEALLRTYARSPKVAQIYIHGNTVDDRLTAGYLRQLHLGKSVRLVPESKYNTPNTRYNPIQSITTESVFITDADVSNGTLYITFELIFPSLRRLCQ